MEAVLRTLREAGFSADMTHHAYHALDSHITGFTLWQVSMPFETKEELVDLAEGFMKKIPADQYPYVIEHAEQHIAPSSPDGKSEFEFGLDLILDGPRAPTRRLGPGQSVPVGRRPELPLRERCVRLGG